MAKLTMKKPAPARKSSALRVAAKYPARGKQRGGSLSDRLLDS